MRKIDPTQFALFRLSRPGFAYNGRTWKEMLNAFKSWSGPCMLIGIREDGSEALIDQK